MVRIPNIGPQGQRQRLERGLLAFGAAGIIAVALFALGVTSGWRLLLLAPLWLGALGVFQAMDKT
jgi:hypothetical protein